MKKLFILLGIICFTLPTVAQERYLDLGSLIEEIELTGYSDRFAYFYGTRTDSSSQREWPFIQQQRFTFPPPGQNVSFIHFLDNQTPNWHKINILPYNGTETFYWRLINLRFGDVTIYEPQPDFTFAEINLSARESFGENTSVAGGITKSIRTSTADTLTYYFKTSSETRNKQIMAITIPLHNVRHTLLRDLPRSFLLGIVFGMVIYNLLLFFALRDRAYAWYVGYVFFYFVALLNWYTFDYQYLAPAFGWWSVRGFYICLSLSLVCIIGFSQIFLQLKLRVPTTYYLTGLFQLGLICYALMFAVFPYFENRITILQLGLFIPSSLLVVCTAIFIYRRYRQKHVKYYLIAFLPLTLFVAIHSFHQQFTGKLFYVGTLTLMDIGLASETVIMSLVLAFRFNLLKEEAEKVHSENERIIVEKGEELTNTIIETQEKERKRISQDLHDELGATLSTIKLHISQWHEKPNSSNQISILLDAGIGQLRSILLNLNPQTLEEDGYGEAMKELAFRISQSGLCETNFFDVNASQYLTRKESSALYRISQELINNTLKYAGASCINIQLICEPDLKFTFTYEDNGRGIDKNIVQGYGLKNVQARVELLHGSFEIDTLPGQGVFVTISFKGKLPSPVYT